MNLPWQWCRLCEFSKRWRRVSVDHLPQHEVATHQGSWSKGTRVCHRDQQFPSSPSKIGRHVIVLSRLLLKSESEKGEVLLLEVKINWGWRIWESGQGDLSGSSRSRPVPSGSSFKTRDRHSGKRKDRDSTFMFFHSRFDETMLIAISFIRHKWIVSASRSVQNIFFFFFCAIQAKLLSSHRTAGLKFEYPGISHYAFSYYITINFLHYIDHIHKKSHDQ